MKILIHNEILSDIDILEDILDYLETGNTDLDCFLTIDRSGIRVDFQTTPVLGYNDDEYTYFTLDTFQEHFNNQAMIINKVEYRN